MIAFAELFEEIHDGAEAAALGGNAQRSAVAFSPTPEVALVAFEDGFCDGVRVNEISLTSPIEKDPQCIATALNGIGGVVPNGEITEIVCGFVGEAARRTGWKLASNVAASFILTAFAQSAGGLASFFSAHGLIHLDGKDCVGECLRVAATPNRCGGYWDGIGMWWKSFFGLLMCDPALRRSSTTDPVPAMLEHRGAGLAKGREVSVTRREVDGMDSWCRVFVAELRNVNQANVPASVRVVCFCDQFVLTEASLPAAVTPDVFHGFETREMEARLSLAPSYLPAQLTAVESGWFLFFDCCFHSLTDEPLDTFQQAAGLWR
jgi:hypothetical protein